jgi:type I restriction enzyme S subunit
MNKTLEEICKAIFKHWFIDFEFPNEQGKPYKSSGGEMVYSKELEKEIPKGWKISTLSENTLTTIGGIWGNENPEGKYSKPAICVRGMDIHEIQNGNQKNLKVLFVDPKTSENRKLNSGDIIVEISGGSTNQLTGRVLFISNELLKRFNHEILPASFCKLIRFSDVNYSIFFYYLLKWVRYIGIISQYETGTTSIKNFQYNIFSKEYKFALPTIDLINTFHQQSSKILIKIESNLYQIQILTKIRDSLLPKLMSGKIRVLVEAD